MRFFARPAQLFRRLERPFASLSARTLATALGFLSSLVVARFFGAEAFGLLGLVTTTLSLATLLCLVGTDQTVVRLVATAAPGHEREPLQSALVLAVRTAVIGLAVAAVVSMLPGIAPDMRNAYGAIALAVLPAAFYELVLAYLRGRGQPLRAQMIEGPISKGLTLAAMVVCALAGWTGTTTPVLVMFATLALCIVIATRASGLRVRDLDIRHAKIDGLFDRSWKILLVTVSIFMTEWLVMNQLSLTRSLREAGVYRAAWQITSALSIATLSFTTMVAPQMAKAWLAGDRHAIRTLWRDGIGMASLTAGPLVLVGIAAPHWVLSWFGSGYDAGATALRILLVAQAFNIVTGPLGTILLMTGRERTSLANSMFAAAICLPLCLYAVPAFGIAGAAAVQALSIVLRNTLALIAVRRLLADPSAASSSSSP